MNRAAVLLIVVCIVAIIGYFSLMGFYLKTAEQISADKIMSSSALWLNTEEGIAKFSGGIVLEPIPVYDGNTTEVIYWIVPVKNSEDLYMGLMVTDEEEFELPDVVMNFEKPRNFLFYISRDDAFSQMIAEHPEYSASQIKEPRLVYDKGQYWFSEVLENGQIIDVLYIVARST